MEILVVGPKNNGVFREVAARGNFSAGIKGPTLLTGGNIDAMKHAVDVTDIDVVPVDTWAAFDRTRFVRPLRFSACQIKSVEISVHRAHIDESIDNRSRSFDGILGFEFPANCQLVGQRR